MHIAMISFQRGSASCKFTVEALNHGFLGLLAPRRLSKHLSRAEAQALNMARRKFESAPTANDQLAARSRIKSSSRQRRWEDIKSVVHDLGEVVPTTVVKPS